MRVRLEDLSSKERAAVQDFKNNITSVFDELYEDKWDQQRWDDAISCATSLLASFFSENSPPLIPEEFKSNHDTSLLMKVIASKERTSDEFWAAREKEFRDGPPIFVRPGWLSPLLGKRVNLDWLDDLQHGRHFIWVKGQEEWEDGWRDRKIAVFQFWTSWCTPCLRTFRQLSDLAETYDASVLIVGVNSEEVFSKDPIDTALVYSFVQKRADINYPIVIDVDKVAVQELFDTAGRRAIPTVFIVSIKDGVVHFVGDPSEMDDAVERVLKSY